MTTKGKIKIIKRGAREAQESPSDTPAQVVPQKKSAQEAARDMVSTVTGWVNEFQQKRRQETARAIKTLLPDTAPQPGKA